MSPLTTAQNSNIETFLPVCFKIESWKVLLVQSLPIKIETLSNMLSKILDRAWLVVSCLSAFACVPGDVCIEEGTAKGTKTIYKRKRSQIHIFCSSHLLCSPFVSLSVLVSCQIRGPIEGPSSIPPSVPDIFIAGRFKMFIPSSTRVEMWLPTLGGVSS